jgi:hypothetical protein
MILENKAKASTFVTLWVCSTNRDFATFAGKIPKSLKVVHSVWCHRAKQGVAEKPLAAGSIWS